MTYWTSWDDERVDGHPLPLVERARDLAERLNLSEEQVGILAAELRNAIAPDWALRPSAGLRRISALCDAMVGKK